MLRSKLYVLFAVLVALPAIAGAQVSSGLQTISLTASKSQSVTISAPVPATQTVTLVDGQANAYANPFSSTVGWDVSQSASTTVKLVVYFSAPSAALTNGSDVIPSSLIEVSTDNGATWHALTGSAVGGVGTAGGSYLLYTSPVTTGTNKKSTNVVTFLVRVNLTTNPGTSAGTYTGTLNLMAICS
jgi:hypothetical protein